jgi:hypothetical protein
MQLPAHRYRDLCLELVSLTFRRFSIGPAARNPAESLRDPPNMRVDRKAVALEE